MDAAQTNLSDDRARQGSPDATANRLAAVTNSERGIPEFTDLVFACRHRIWQTLLLGIALSAGLFAINWWLTEPQFQAEALVRVREQQDVVFTPQTSRAADTAFFHSQEKLALSPQVLQAALHRGNVQALAHALPAHNRVQWLREQLVVKTQAGAEVMSVTASHTSPELAQALATAVTESYLQEVTNRQTQDRQRRERELERAAQDADRRLDDLWNELNRLAQSIGSDSTQSLTIRDELQYQAYRDYARQLREAQSRGVDLQRLLEDQRAVMQSESRETGLLVDVLLQQHPDVIAARGRVSATEQQIQEMKQIVAQEDSPRLQRLIQDRDFYQRQFQRTVDQLRPKLEQQAENQSRNEVETAVAQLQKQIELNRTEKDYLRQRLSELDQGIARTDNRSGVKLEKARHAVDRQSRLADGLWQSLQELRIERQSQPRVTLIELADLPEKPSRSRQLKIAGAGWIGGWMLAVLSVGYIEWRGCRVRTLENITHHTSLPVFGADVLITGSSFPLGRRTTNSGVGEAAARLILHNDGNRACTVMVAGCETQEPNHLVANELAAALSRFHRRVLLIDADASASPLSHSMRASSLPGLRQVTPITTDVKPLIQTTDDPRVDFLAAGQPEQSDDWIDPRTLQRVLEQTHHDYDVILVCGPALLASAESLLLAAEVDSVLFSVFVGRSRWNQLVASQQCVLDSGNQVAGSIVHSGHPDPQAPAAMTVQGQRQPGDAMISGELALQQQCEQLQRELQQVRSELQPQATPQATHEETSA